MRCLVVEQVGFIFNGQAFRLKFVALLFRVNVFKPDEGFFVDLDLEIFDVLAGDHSLGLQCLVYDLTSN